MNNWFSPVPGCNSERIESLNARTASLTRRPLDATQKELKVLGRRWGSLSVASRCNSERIERYVSFFATLSAGVDATQKELKATAPNAGAVAAAGLGVTDATQKELKGFSIERVRVVVQAQQLRKN